MKHEIQLPFRQKSLSNNSSMNTPKLMRRITESNRQPELFFSQILRNGKKYQRQGSPQHLQSDLRSSQIQKENKQSSKYSEKNSKNSRIQVRQVLVDTPPCKQLSFMLRNHQLSVQYIKQMELHKFKPLVIISVLLPFDMMKKFTKLIDFKQQYKISTLENVFITDFIKFNSPNKDEEINYVFWICQISESTQTIKNDSMKQSMLDIRQSYRTSKSMKQMKSLKFNKPIEQKYKNNLIKMIVELPQIVITTKNFIKLNTKLFFPSSQNDQILSNLSSDQHSKNIVSQLNLEKTLLYFDSQNGNKQFSRYNTEVQEIYTPKNNTGSQKNSVLKSNNEYKINIRTTLENGKNPQSSSSNPYIQLEAEEQFYEDQFNLKRKKESYEGKKQKQGEKIGYKKQLYIDPSNYLQKPQKSDTDLKQLLESESIFKFVKSLPVSWLQQMTENSTPSNKSNTIQKEQKRGRRPSFNTTSKPYTIASERLDKFKLFLTEQIKLTLKKNWNYCKFCSSWIYLYFLMQYYKYNTKTEIQYQQDNVKSLIYGEILEHSLKRFKKEIEEMYYSKIESQYTQVLDEDKLTKILRQIKKQLIIFLKKNLFSLVYPSTKSGINGIRNYETNITKQYVSELQYQIMSFIEQMQEQIYYENNKKAIVINQKILEQQYEKIIEAGFKRQKFRKKQSIESMSSINSDERPILSEDKSSIHPSRKDLSRRHSHHQVSTQLQKDFSRFLQVYSEKSLKVSSQLRTFNGFMQKQKSGYLRLVGQLTRDKDKKDQTRQQQQKQNKSRMIKLLELQIQKLQQRRRDIKQKNQVIKKKIDTRVIDQGQTPFERMGRGDKTMTFYDSQSRQFSKNDRNGRISQVIRRSQKGRIRSSKRLDKNHQKQTKRFEKSGFKSQNLRQAIIEQQRQQQQKQKRCCSKCQIM